jgi:hypothetical protein
MFEALKNNPDLKGLIWIIAGAILLLNTFDLLEILTDKIVMLLSIGMIAYGFLLAHGPQRLVKWSKQLFNK